MFLLIILLLSSLLFILSSLYEMQMLQQNSYNENHKYFHYLNKDLTGHNMKDYLLKFLFALVLLLYDNMPSYLKYFYIFVMIVLIISSLVCYKKHNKKLPLKFTKRVGRIIFLDYLFYIMLCLISSITLSSSYVSGLLLLYIALNGYILIFIVFLLKPVEKMIFNHYKKEALLRLHKMNNLKIIGITGSFGKTSTKMILDSILKTTYKGFYTPASFNTPNGLLLTINNEKTIFNDYFISEMGAKKNGEIKELCDLVNPSYGILTSIGAAHLESFKTLDNICKTKFELIESLPESGVGVLNKDDEYQRNYHLNNKCHIIWIGIDNDADVMAKDIKVTSKGTSFKIVFNKKNKQIDAETILLGNKNVYNILAAAALADYLGVNENNIIKGIKSIPAITHRLELKEFNNITLLDDSFNSNPEGAKNAIDVLSLMEGTKIIITPGMIEMGKEEEKLNYTFGTQIAKVCDYVYLVGPKKSKPIYDGLLSQNYPKDKIKVFNSFTSAYDDVINKFNKEKAIVLIENDLPDSYTEV